MLFCMLIGEDTAGYSTLFIMGDSGLSTATLAQLLLLAVLITVAQVIFLTDRLIVTMAMPLRNVLFFLSILAVIVILIMAFGWFPLNDAKAWAGFLISFVLSMLISVMVTRLKECAENAKMQEALDKYNGIK